jgi:hypothetical protein
LIEADAARLTFDEREQYLRHFAPRSNPAVMSSFDVQSITGATVVLCHSSAVHLDSDEAVARRG